MKRIIVPVLIVSLFAVGALAAPPVSNNPANTVRDQLLRIERNLTLAEFDLREATIQINALDGRVTTLEQIFARTRDAARVREALVVIRAEAATLQAEMQRLTSEFDRLHGELARMQVRDPSDVEMRRALMNRIAISMEENQETMQSLDSIGRRIEVLFDAVTPPGRPR